MPNFQRTLRTPQPPLTQQPISRRTKLTKRRTRITNHPHQPIQHTRLHPRRHTRQRQHLRHPPPKHPQRQQLIQRHTRQPRQTQQLPPRHTRIQPHHQRQLLHRPTTRQPNQPIQRNHTHHYLPSPNPTNTTNNNTTTNTNTTSTHTPHPTPNTKHNPTHQTPPEKYVREGKSIDSPAPDPPPRSAAGSAERPSIRRSAQVADTLFAFVS